MEIKDFRTGNILEYRTAEGDWLETKLDWQDFKWLEEDPSGFQSVHRFVPLTSELLARMGFKDKQVYENVDEWYKKPLCLQTDQDIFMAVRIGVDDLEVKYVHQLQNLYYALTGTELTLK